MIICFFGTFNIVFFQGFMSTTLVALGLPESATGYVYGSQSFTYLVFCLILPFTCERSPRKF